MLVGGLLFSASILVFGLANGYLLIIVAYVGWAVSHTFYSGANSAFLYDSLSAIGREAEFGRVMGRVRATAISAAVLATLIGAPLAAATDFSVPILISAGLALVSLVVVFTFHEPPMHKDAPRLSYFGILREAATYTAGHATLRSMMALTAVLMSGLVLAHIFVQPFLADNGVSVGQLGLFLVIADVMAIGGALASHRLTVALGEKRVLYLIVGVMTGSFLVLGSVGSLAAFAAFPVLYFSASVLMPLSTDYVNRHSPQHLRATMASIGSMGVSLVVVATQPGFGLAADEASMTDAFLLAAVFVGVAGALAFAVWQAADRRGDNEGASTPSGAAVAAAK